MTYQVYGYMFVDHTDTTPELQAEKLGSATLFCDYGTAHESTRPALNDLLSQAMRGDMIYVERLSRIARTVTEFYDLLVLLSSRGVGFEAVEEAFILRPALGASTQASDGAPFNDLELIKCLATLEQIPSPPKGNLAEDAPFWTPNAQQRTLSLTQLVTAESYYRAGVPLARVAASYSVTPAELFKAIRRDQGYSTYPPTSST